MPPCSPGPASWITWFTPPVTRVGQRALSDLPLDEARQLFEVRFWGAVAAVKHAAPRLRPGGSIVLTSGTVGVRPAPGAALAASGAAAIEGLTRGLAVELAPVRVNAVRPGVIRTPMWDQIPEPQREALFTTLAERTLTKAVGEPDQIAATHLYLMENRFVTGTVLTVDGGSVLTGSYAPGLDGNRTGPGPAGPGAIRAAPQLHRAATRQVS